MISKKTDIVINVELDENKIPEKMSWSAKDGGITDQQTKAFLFSSWDFLLSKKRLKHISE